MSPGLSKTGREARDPAADAVTGLRTRPPNTRRPTNEERADLGPDRHRAISPRPLERDHLAIMPTSSHLSAPPYLYVRCMWMQFNFSTTQADTT